MCSNNACTGGQARAVSDTYDEAMGREGSEREKEWKVAKQIRNLEYDNKTMIQTHNETFWGIHTLMKTRQLHSALRCGLRLLLLTPLFACNVYVFLTNIIVC